MWIVLLPSLIAFLVGLLLFLVIIPRLSFFFSARVQSSQRIDDFQKLKLLNFLDCLHNDRLPKRSQRSINLLSVYMFVLLGFQHYFLFNGRGFMAGMMVAGMFALLIAHSFSDI
jgi:hypothetical protein